MKRSLFYCWLGLFIFFCQACQSDTSQKSGKHVGAEDSTHNITVASGTLERYIISSDYVDDRNVDVWLPESFSKDEQYPVLYMHDGQMLFDSTTTWNNQEWKIDEVAGKLITEGKISPVIVVGVWNNGDQRFAEYFPEKAVNYIPKTQQDSLMKLGPVNLKADKYLTFLVDELKPFIDSTYSTQPGPEHTFLMGSSMGGLISIYGLSEYPEVFGGAACLSTHWVGTSEAQAIISKAISDYLASNLPDPGSHKIYFDHGTATLDSLYPPHQDRIDQIMTEKGYSSENWMSREFKGADHSEKSWSGRLHIPLTFLLEK